MPGVEDFLRTNAADVARPARDENVHGELKTALGIKSRGKWGVYQFESGTFQDKKPDQSETPAKNENRDEDGR
jgi:hypothetical protein